MTSVDTSNLHGWDPIDELRNMTQDLSRCFECRILTVEFLGHKKTPRTRKSQKKP